MAPAAEGISEAKSAHHEQNGYWSRKLASERQSARQPSSSQEQLRRVADDKIRTDGEPFRAAAQAVHWLRQQLESNGIGSGFIQELVG
jgi:hypothetical protein